MNSYRDMRDSAPEWHSTRMPKPVAVATTKPRGRPPSNLTADEVQRLRDAARQMLPHPLVLSTAAILAHIGRRRLETECQRGELIKFGEKVRVKNSRRMAMSIVFVD